VLSCLANTKEKNVFRKFLLLPCFLLLGALTSAQTSGSIYFGYSYYDTNLSTNRGSLNGWNGTLEGKVLPHVGIVADISGDYGNLNFKPLNVTCPITGCPTHVSTHETNVMFGPRVSLPIGKFRPFAEAMAGVGHASASGFGSDTWLSAVASTTVSFTCSDGASKWITSTPACSIADKATPASPPESSSTSSAKISSAN
jgi:hypothetical protein